MLELAFDALILTALFSWIPFERRGVVAPLILAALVLVARLVFLIVGKHA